MNWYPFLENRTFFDLTCSHHSGREINKLGALLEQMEKMLTLGKNEGRRRRGQQRMRQLDGIADSMNMSLSKLPERVKDKVTKSWTRLIVWVNSESWWWTGRPGVLWFMGSQRVGHDWATELNWTIDWTTTWNIMKATVINNNSTFPTTHVATSFTSLTPENYNIIATSSLKSSWFLLLKASFLFELTENLLIHSTAFYHFQPNDVFMSMASVSY